MGLLGSENVKMVESWDVSKSKGSKKMKKDKENEGVIDEGKTKTGCWVGLRFIGSCIPSRSKVDSSVSGSGTSTHYGNHCFLGNVLLLIVCSYDVFGDSMFVKCVCDMILFMYVLRLVCFFRCFSVWFAFEISLSTFFCNLIEYYHVNWCKMLPK